MWNNLKYAIQWSLIRVFLFNLVLGGSGVFLVVYGVISEVRPALRNPLFDTAASWIAPVVTFVGVAITAASVYFEPKDAKRTRPDPASKLLVAPIVLIACAMALFAQFEFGKVPDHVVNGLALLGLAGALFRIQPNPQRAASTF